MSCILLAAATHVDALLCIYVSTHRSNWKVCVGVIDIFDHQDFADFSSEAYCIAKLSVDDELVEELWAALTFRVLGRWLYTSVSFVFASIVS